MRGFLRGVLILLLIFLIGVSTEAIRISLMHWPPDPLNVLSSDQEEPSPCSQRRFLAEPTTIGRKVEVDARGDTATIMLSLMLPREHGCVDALIREGFAENGMLLTQVFGRLRVDRVLRAQDFTLDAPSFSSGQEQVRLTARAFIPFRNFLVVSVDLPDTIQSAVMLASDSVVVRLDSTRAVTVNVPPEAMSDSLLVYDSVSQGRPLYVSLIVHRAEGAAADEGMDVRATLSVLDHWADIPVLSTFFTQFVSVIPLLILLVATRATREQDAGFAAVREQSRLLALLGLVAAGAAAFVLNIHREWYVGLSRLAEEALEGKGIPVSVRLLLGNGFGYVIPLSLGLLAPAALLHDRSRRGGAGWWRVALTRLVVLVLLAIGLAGVFALEEPVWSRGRVPYLLILLGTALLLLWITCELLLGALGRRWMDPFLLLGVLLGAPLLASFDWWSRGRLAHSFVWLGITMAVGVAVIRTMSDVLRGGLHAEAPSGGLGLPSGAVQRWRRASPWTRRALHAAVLLLLTLPVGGLANPEETFSAVFHSNTPVSVPVTMLFILPVVWLIALLRYLHQQGRAGIEVVRSTRILAVAGLAALLFGVRAEWFNLPLTFFFGCLALGYVLLRGDGAGWALTSSAQLMAVRALRTARLLELRVAETAYRAVRRNRIADLRKGVVELSAYQEEVRKWKEILRRLKSDVGEDATTIERYALGLGPEGSAWENAMRGVRYSALFAIPWIIVAIAGLLGSQPNWLYPQWTVVGELAYAVGKWLAFGFALGYFFPYLPGSSGLDKGLVLFAVTTLPLLPVTALAPPTIATWQPLLIWSVQVFVHCVLLGLFAFDYAVLRRTGDSDWRLVFEVHGWSAVGISISSLTLAVGAAVATLVSDQAASLIVSALKLATPFVLPEGGAASP